jgi:hypothetical protein
LRGFWCVFNIAIKIIIEEARACAIKYLIVDSEECELILENRIGIKLIKLISNPSQHEIHEEEEIAKNVPRKRQIK